MSLYSPIKGLERKTLISPVYQCLEPLLKISSTCAFFIFSSLPQTVLQKTADIQAFVENVTFEPHKTENYKKLPLSLDTSRFNTEVRSSTPFRRAVRSLVELSEKMLEYESKDSNDQFF